MNLRSDRLLFLLFPALFLFTARPEAQVCRLSGIYGPGGRGIGPPPIDTLGLPFVDGLIMYPDWATLEPAPFVYDFSSVEELIALVQPNPAVARRSRAARTIGVETRQQGLRCTQA